jgi:hypothetical protein
MICRDWDGYFEVDFAVILHIWSHLVAAGVTCNCKRDKIRWRKGHARVGEEPYLWRKRTRSS